MSVTPSPNGSNGRDAGGRFAKGNPGGPGNPLAAKVGRLREAAFDAVSEADMRAVLAKLVEQAKAGDIQAAKVLLDRCLGRTLEADLIERMEALEDALAERASA